MEYTVEIKRSNRKSIGFEIKEAGILIVRAPRFLTRVEILRQVEKHEDWIQKHMELAVARERAKRELPKYSQEEIKHMAEEALRVIPPKVYMYSRVLGVTYGRITIRNQKTRWGSCSAKGNLNFNCLLIQVPERVLDYVVIHELCHRIEMNHSKRFWNLVEQVMPDYRDQRRWLKDYGAELIERMHS